MPPSGYDPHLAAIFVLKLDIPARVVVVVVRVDNVVELQAPAMGDEEREAEEAH